MNRTIQRIAGGTAVALLVLGGLAACSDDDDTGDTGGTEEPAGSEAE